MRSKSHEIGAYANTRVLSLQHRLLSGKASDARATLAQLRRLGTGDRSAWMLVGDVLLRGWPEDELGLPDADSREYRAVEAALGLYAVHQQSMSDPMALDGQGGQDKRRGSFGSACRHIDAGRSAESETVSGVQRRLASIEATSDFDGVLVGIRGLMRLLNDRRVPLDYYTFARDLYLLQFPGARDDVFARWGRDYFLSSAKEAEPENDGSAA